MDITLLNGLKSEIEGLIVEVEGPLTSNCGQETTYVAAIHNMTGLTAAELNQKLRDYANKVGAYDRCGHSHDCCGCEFLARARFISEWPEDDYSLLYTETYALNY
jgi:hypothetical protein